MATRTPKPSEIAMDAFRRNVQVRKEAIGIGSDRELYHMVKQRLRHGDAPSEKTVNNAVEARHDAKISTLDAIAEGLGVPLWLLLIPDMPPELLKDPAANRLVRLVEDYISSAGEGRQHIENIAAAAAFQAQKPS